MLSVADQPVHYTHTYLEDTEGAQFTICQRSSHSEAKLQASDDTLAVDSSVRGLVPKCNMTCNKAPQPLTVYAYTLHTFLKPATHMLTNMHAFVYVM